jgi:DNA-binding CsgD family transcriptional regulator
MKKGRRQDSFERTRSQAKDRLREHKRNFQFLESLTAVYPGDAAHQILRRVLFERRRWRRYLRRRFGVRMVNTDGLDRPVSIKNSPVRILEQARWGRDTLDREELNRLAREYVKEYWRFTLAMQAHFVCDLSFSIMRKRSDMVLNLPGAECWPEREKLSRVSLAVVEGFVLVQQHKHELLDLLVPPGELPPSLREVVAGILVGQTEAEISLTKNKRLSASLEGWDTSAKQRLLADLPGAVMEAWGAGEAMLDDGKHRNLVQRVARALERAGDEANSLARRDKLSPFKDVAEADDEVAAFELREQARQQIAALEEKAGFSKQQAEIWALLRQGMDIAEIANEVGIPRQQVSTQKKRIKDKILKVRAAAEF